MEKMPTEKELIEAQNQLFLEAIETAANEAEKKELLDAIATNKRLIESLG